MYTYKFAKLLISRTGLCVIETIEFGGYQLICAQANFIDLGEVQLASDYLDSASAAVRNVMLIANEQLLIPCPTELLYINLFKNHRTKHVANAM